MLSLVMIPFYSHSPWFLDGKISILVCSQTVSYGFDENLLHANINLTL